MLKKFNINTLNLILLFAIWLSPLLQSNIMLFKTEALGGVTSDQTKDTVLNAETWFSGTYAQVEQTFLNDNFGFREIAIRLQNQIQYSVFNHTKTEDVIVGENNYLFELKYIHAYNGSDYVGENYFRDKLEKIKFIQDTLKALNKTLIFIIAPSKVAFFPEHIPNKYKKDRTNTNYKTLKKIIDSYHINYIDYMAMFSKLKSSSKYDLYPYAGTHWSEYGNILALDTLKKYIENHTDFVLPTMDYSEMVLLDGYQGADNDMGKAINLLFLPNYGKLAYPKLKIIEGKNVKKPNVLMVSDSYWMSVYNSNKPKKMFKKHAFWYYYNISYDYGNETDFKAPVSFNLKEELSKFDVICVMGTEPNLKAIGYRFIEDCYDLFKTGSVNNDYRWKMAQIEKTRMYLWNDDKTFRNLSKKAIQEKKPLDSLITNLAKYMFDTSK